MTQWQTGRFMSLRSAFGRAQVKRERRLALSCSDDLPYTGFDADQVGLPSAFAFLSTHGEN
jgi:hypothetical protein